MNRWSVSVVKLVITFVCSGDAFALTQQEFVEGSHRLHQRQRQTQAALEGLGVRSMGFDTPKAHPTGESDKELRPLFQIHADLKSARIPTGKLLYGKTLNRLVVGSEGAPVIVVLDDNQGTLSRLRLIGGARQGGTEGRVVIELGRLLLLGGKAIPVQATALDAGGAYGLEAQVFSSQALAMGGALASGFISGFAASQQTQTVSPYGFSTTQPTGRNAILQGVAQSASDQSKRLIEQATSEKPVLVVETQTPLAVLVQEEVSF